MPSPLAVLFLPILAQLATAHFELVYPPWRGDSFIPPASQYIFPCAGINSTGDAGNRTVWSPTGGSLVIDFHHPFTYMWLNLGLGTNTSTFNISLNSMPYNETGNGTLCFPDFRIPSDLGLDLSDGTNATLQVITVGDSGTALYNCADITFSSNATFLEAGQGLCKNDTGVSISLLNPEVNGSTSPSASAASSSGASATAPAAAASSSSMAHVGADLWRGSLFAGLLSAILLGFHIVVWA